jgi:hypothetical protein
LGGGRRRNRLLGLGKILKGEESDEGQNGEGDCAAHIAAAAAAVAPLRLKIGIAKF